VVGYVIFSATTAHVFDVLVVVTGASAAILYLLGVIVEHMIQVKTQSEIEVFKHDGWEVRQREKEIVDKIKPKKVKWCAYSAASTVRHGVIKALMEEPRSALSIKLLLCHPEGVYSGQKSQWLDTMRALHLLYHTYQNTKARSRVPVEIKFYKDPASLRGRNFDDKYVTLGWYTFAYEGKHKKANGRNEEYAEQTYKNIWGMENPVVVAPTGNENGKS